MKTRLKVYGRGDNSSKLGDFAREVNRIGKRRKQDGAHRGAELPDRPARWVLGKSGDTGTQDFDVLFAGQDSATTNSEIGGYVLDYRTPASVGIFWRDGDDPTRDEVEKAFDAAVERGLQYGVHHAFKAKVDEELVPLSGVHAVEYFHTMTSTGLGDPALHQHILINNYGFLPTGAIAAIDVDHFQDQLAPMCEIVGAEFRDQMSRRLSVKWAPEVNGKQEIAGIALPAKS